MSKKCNCDKDDLSYYVHVFGDDMYGPFNTKALAEEFIKETVEEGNADDMDDIRVFRARVVPFTFKKQFTIIIKEN